MNSPKATILLVEDEPDVLRTMVMLLEYNGYRIHTAMDGDSAYAVLQKESVDLVCLDEKLPGQSGLDILDQLKKNRITAGIPVVMVTAVDASQSEEEALAKGASAYITKPFDLQTLIQTIDRVLNR